MSQEFHNNPDHDPLLGQQVGGFRISHLLGHGGMGRVYEAVQVSVGRRVALKVLKHALQDHEQLMRRFRREAQVVAQLNHPNIVTLFDFGTTSSNTSYIAMEYVDGEPLTDYLQASLHMGFVVHVFQHVLSALAEAHRMGIVHRDLKPDNIMLTTVGADDAFAKVLDFGLALLASDEDIRLTQAGEVFGTPLYMSPEQASGEHDITASTDFYSLACIIYELMSGHPPFTGRKAMHVLMKHVHEPVPPLRPKDGLDPSPEFEALLMRCLSKGPQDRPQSAEQILAELSQTPEAGYFSSSVLPIIDDSGGSLSLRLSGRNTPHGGVPMHHTTPRHGTTPVSADHTRQTNPRRNGVNASGPQGSPSRPPSLFELLEGDEGETLFDEDTPSEAPQAPSHRRALALLAVLAVVGALGAWLLINPPWVSDVVPARPGAGLTPAAQNPSLNEHRMAPVNPERAAITGVRDQLHAAMHQASDTLQQRAILALYNDALSNRTRYQPGRRIQPVLLAEGITWTFSVHFRLMDKIRDKSYTDPIHLLYGPPIVQR